MASLQSVAPIFPTADMDAMQRALRGLGFAVHVHGGRLRHGARDGIRIHFQLVPGLEPGGGTGRGLPRGRRRRRAARGVAGGRRWARPLTCSTPVRRLGGGAHRRRREPAALRLPDHALTPAAPDGTIRLDGDDGDHVRPAAYLTANATSRSLATSCAERPGGFLLGRCRIRVRR